MVFQMELRTKIVDIWAQRVSALSINISIYNDFGYGLKKNNKSPISLPTYIIVKRKRLEVLIRRNFLSEKYLTCMIRFNNFSRNVYTSCDANKLI